jgi:hypothetical protein
MILLSKLKCNVWCGSMGVKITVGDREAQFWPQGGASCVTAVAPYSSSALTLQYPLVVIYAPCLAEDARTQREWLYDHIGV